MKKFFSLLVVAFITWQFILNPTFWLLGIGIFAIAVFLAI